MHQIIEFEMKDMNWRKIFCELNRNLKFCSKFWLRQATSLLLLPEEMSQLMLKWNCAVLSGPSKTTTPNGWEYSTDGRFKRKE